MPGLPGSALLQGLDTGSALFSRMMQPKLQREKQEQLERHFQQEMALRKQAAARAGANSDLQHQLLQEHILAAKHANDPMFAMNQLKNKIDFLNSLKGQQGGAMAGAGMPSPQGQGNQQNYLSSLMSGQEEMPQGLGPMMNMGQDSMQQEAQPDMGHNQMLQGQGQSNQQLPGGINMDDIIRGLTYQSMGLKAPTSKSGAFAEPPELKRQNDLQSKMQLAKYNHELKLDQERTNNELKNTQTRQKVIDTAKNDLPHLAETLRSLKVMKKIAEDKKNDDMFGHWWWGQDQAANHISNPNAGTWQVYGLDPIIDAEMKMSGRGNQLALKTSLRNKPNFAEPRSTALSKLNGAIEKIMRQIEITKKISNYSDSKNEFGKMSDDELRAIIGGG